jgi:phage/plasmid-associated DNA primase
MLLKIKRIIFSNEIKSTVEINGNMIKKIASGGDTLIGRNHGSGEEEFNTHFLPVCFANDLPKIKPYDDAVNNRVRIISYNKSYVDEPSNEFELRKDLNIENEIKTLRFQRVMVGLLIREYSLYKQNGLQPEPDEVLNSKEEWVGEEANCIKSFLNDYEITNDANHYVKSNDIKSWLEQKKFGISMEKFSKELKKYCCINHFENIDNKYKKIGGKSIRVWCGVNIIKETSYEDDMEL